ncbi:MAG: DUF1998 domain-containing protein, partial [Dehalococcoidia bacterium]
GKIAIPEANVHTTAYWLSFHERAVEGLRRDELAAGLDGVGHLARNLAPVYCLCDPHDIGVSAQVKSPYNGRPVVFLYDSVPGGVGLAERLFDVREELVEACLGLVNACTCPNGCPGCVGPQVEANSPAKKAARMMLERVLGR